MSASLRDASHTNEARMNITLSAGPVVSLIAGILILIGM